MGNYWRYAFHCGSQTRSSFWVKPLRVIAALHKVFQCYSFTSHCFRVGETHAQLRSECGSYIVSARSLTKLATSTTDQPCEGSLFLMVVPAGIEPATRGSAKPFMEPDYIFFHSSSVYLFISDDFVGKPNFLHHFLIPLSVTPYSFAMSTKVSFRIFSFNVSLVIFAFTILYG